MRLLALMLIASALGAAEMRQLGPNEDLPYCRVVVNAASTIDKDPPVYETHDGWYCADTGHLYPASEKGILIAVAPINLNTVVKVTPLGAPGRMPAQWRSELNAFIAKHHPQTRAASPVPAASKP